ncbi:M14 family metallopeptidase [Pelagicoccus albus]|uniref:M14 family metallocarboxypeptidase n=1 Tax=Pelagicoccus albus TaxID=415222 RepID=A0A7X1B4W8_9BACT|nr:M14 family metallocarboxypeptidase [Pelagicoccus albus]MBC2605469.1 M14 family metallocarboxypeptidase [Pelagicoccus albus]
MSSKPQPEPENENHSQRFDLAAFESDVDSLAASAGFAKHEIWQDGLGHAINLWTKESATPDAPSILISAGMHGDEPAGPLALLELFKNYPFSEQFEWLLTPVLNPTGLLQGTRENASGIDQNRDFLLRQSPEIKAYTNWWESHRTACALHLSLHEDWETDGYYFYAINSSQLPCYSKELQQILSKKIPLQQTGPVDDHELAAPGLIVHPCEADEPEGWPEAIWLTKSHPTLSYTFEAPSSHPLEDRVKGLETCLKVALDRSHAALVDCSSQAG